ncbi:BID domain-containing T4SS effector [Bartonella ancashensis]|uniref:Uncharacterized protein n=1 Tax=Bartonella ancashensis TaxID=1318743 RepID=A0A0M4L646_9HYPH|nr:BID domain-containing T4SS effector [Bartonella ancashensis]ALE03033.1 hypothetical protein PU02_0219 [Bartonella ancashensis]ARE31035.1 Bep219 [Bartonella ancashensis]
MEKNVHGATSAQVSAASENYTAEGQRATNQEILIHGSRKCVKSFSPEEMITMIRDDYYVQESCKEIRRLSKIVYGDKSVLDGVMEQAVEFPLSMYDFLEKMKNDPVSVSKLAGIKTSFFKNKKREAAEQNISSLEFMVENHIKVIGYAKERIIDDYQKAYERGKISVPEPSKNLMKLFFLSPTQQRESLSQSPEMKSELDDYVKLLDRRLSPNDHKAIQENRLTDLAESVDVSPKQAEKIAEIVKLAKSAQQQVQQPQTKQQQMVRSL